MFKKLGAINHAKVIFKEETMSTRQYNIWKKLMKSICKEKFYELNCYSLKVQNSSQLQKI